jgi:hypothetical protein
MDIVDIINRKIKLENDISLLLQQFYIDTRCYNLTIKFGTPFEIVDRANGELKKDGVTIDIKI